LLAVLWACSLHVSSKSIVFLNWKSLMVIGEPPLKKQRPQVPGFFDTAVGHRDKTLAEEERRRKAGLPPLDPSRLPSAARAPNAVAASIAAGATPRAPDVITGAQTSSPPAGAPAASASSAPPPPVPAAEELLQAQHIGKAGVYGFIQPTVVDTQRPGKAIALRLEPLKPGLPEFEKVLGEHKQSVVIGSQRGVADVVVVDEIVSKKHIILSLIGVHGELALSIADYSTNGTWMNGERLREKKKKYRVRSGDKILVMDPTLDDEFGWKVDFGNTVAYFSR